MGLFRRPVRRFTKAESFQSFIEGVRELHHYDKEADENEPDAGLLCQHLKKAEEYFRECVETYPDDLLPRYYFGIVLSVRGQVEQARRLRSELEETKSDPATISPDELFLQAAKHFEKIADQVGGGKDGRDLLVFAQYNQAQALAKTEPIKKD
jgi:tetratricopeptide (TPR) repeat protein